MGVSTNAYLFYGIARSEEGYPWNWGKEYSECDYNRDEDDKIADAFGIDRADWKAVWDKKKELNCEIGTHCSDECPMYYVAISESEQTAYRGDIERVNVENDPIKLQAWDEELKKYCELMGIEYSQPQWLMVSYWG